MAALEKIRKRAALLLLVVGLALAAFVVEDGVRAARSLFTDNSAAEVDGDEIDIQTFQKRSEKLSEQLQNQQQKVDPAVMQQQLLQQMINEQLQEKEYEAAGIAVSQDELNNAVTGNQPMQMATQFAQSNGFQTAAQMNQFLQKPVDAEGKPLDKSQVKQLQAMWDDMVVQVEQQLKLFKLYDLASNSIQANDLDRKLIQEDLNNTYAVNIVRKDFTSVPDSKVKVEESDLKAAYDKYKERFKIDEEQRVIHYIAQEVALSDKDQARDRALFARADSALRQPGLSGLRTLTDFTTDSMRLTMAQAKADTTVQNFLKSASVGAIKRMPQQGKYTVYYKLLSTYNSIDSVTLSMVQVQGDKKFQDQILAQLNGGKSIQELTNANKGKVQGQDNIPQQIGTQPDSIRSKIASATAQYIVLQSTAQGALLVKTTKTDQAKTFYTLGQATYMHLPSQTTIDNLRTKLQNYVNKYKNDITAFEKNASKEGFIIRETTVTPSTPQLEFNPQMGGGIANTRKAIKWAFDNKTGAVSPIFSDNSDVNIVIALDAVYDGDYMPLSNPQVKEMLTQIVRNEKKGEYLMKEYDGKAQNLDAYAKLMSSKVEAIQINLADPMIAGINPADIGLAGRVAGAQVGKLGKLYQGQTAIYAYQVTKVERSPRKQSKEELSQRFLQATGLAALRNYQYIPYALRGGVKVKNNLIKFY